MTRWTLFMRILVPAALLLLAGCVGDVVPNTDDDSTDDDSAADDDDTADDDDDTSAVDCNNLPAGPLPYNTLSNIKATEDFALDDAGYAIGADHNGALYKSDYAGNASLWIPSGGYTFVSGIRALPTGDIVYSDVNTGTLYRIDAATGDETAVLSGLNYANGLEVDLDGYVYAAEQSGNRVRRIDPYTGDFTMVAMGLNNPNGISFSPDYTRLYVGSFGGGTVTELELDANGNLLNTTTLVSNLGNGQLDGMGVDACGNVYVCEYINARVWRISPDGLTRDVIADLHASTSWIPNFQWGSGVGGWDDHSIYVLDYSTYRAFEIDVGVPGKPRAYP